MSDDPSAGNNEQDFDVNLLELCFNKDGLERTILFADIDEDILTELKEFLSIISSHGIYLNQETFEKMIEDIGCTCFDITEDDVVYNPIPLMPDNKKERKIAADDAFDALINALDKKDINFQLETINLIKSGISINNPSIIDHISMPSN